MPVRSDKNLLNAEKEHQIFYQDEIVKVTSEGVQIFERFYPIREIRKIYLQRAENRFVWIRMFICLGLLIPAIAIAEDFLGRGPVGFLMIVGLTAPLLLVGGGAVYSLCQPAYYLYFQSFLYDNRVLESQSPFQIIKIKRAVLKAMKQVQKEESLLEASGKIVNFF